MKIFALAALLLLLSACTGLPGLAGKIIVISPGPATAMRACATLSDLLTAGYSPLAAIDLALARGNLGAGSLGAAPIEALENCAAMLRVVTDITEK